MEETAAVARAMRVPLAADCVPRLLEVLSRFDPTARASQYHDLVAGRRLELESLNGTTVRLGRQHGVPTPRWRPDSCGKEKWRIFSVDWSNSVTPLAGRTERRYADADVATEGGRGQAGR